MDVCARALTIAGRMIEDGALDKYVKDRYAEWDSADGKAILAGKVSLADLAKKVEGARKDGSYRIPLKPYAWHWLRVGEGDNVLDRDWLDLAPHGGK